MAFRLGFENSTKSKDQVLGKLLTLIHKGKRDNEFLYGKLYPGRPFSEKQMRNLRSELFKRLTDFLAHHLFENSPEKTLFVARSLNQIHAIQHFPAIVEKYKRQLGSQRWGLEQGDLDNRLRLEFLQYHLAKEGRKGLPVGELMEGTEEAFVARTLYQALAFHEAKRLHEGETPGPPIVLWEGILAKLEAGAWAESILVQLYFALYKVVVAPEDKDSYGHAKSLLTKHGHQCSTAEAEQMYTVALNRCVQMRNRGDFSMVHEIFHLYEEMLNRSILVSSDGMDVWHFKSIVTTAIWLGKFEWAREFMEEYQGQLAEQFREILLNYCQGLLAFHERDFEEAEQKMNRVLEDYNDPFMGLDARSCLIRIHYETGNMRGMEALLNSFRMFLRRHQHLSEKRLGNYREFTRFFRRFIALGPDKSQKAVKLRQEILASPHRASREWLLSKLEPFMET